MPPTLAPPILISDDDSLARLVQELSGHPIIAVDTESNSLHAYRELGDQQALPGDLVRQFAMPRGIDPVQPGAHHCDGGHRIGAGAVQRPCMGGAVDAEGEPGDHRHVRFGKGPGEAAGILQALRRGVAAADDRQGPLRRGCRQAHAIQHQGRVFDGEQAGRIVRIAEGQDLAVGGIGLQPGQRRLELRRETVSLDGAWEVRIDPADVEKVTQHPKEAKWFPARVPGSVQQDLIAAGRAPGFGVFTGSSSAVLSVISSSSKPAPSPH